LGSDGCAAPLSADSALQCLTSSEGRIHGCNVLPAVGMPAIEKTMTVLPWAGAFARSEQSRAMEN